MKKREAGRLLVRMPPELHRELKDRSLESAKSLNEYCVELLSFSVNRGQNASEVGEPWISALQAWLKKDLKAVILFGSAARGEATSDSDRDYLIVLSKQVDLNPDLYRTWDRRLGSSVSRKFSPHFVYLPEGEHDAGSIWLEAAIDGIVLWDPSGQVNRLFQTLRRAMAAGEIQRKEVHGHPYWVRREKGKKAS